MSGSSGKDGARTRDLVARPLRLLALIPRWEDVKSGFFYYALPGLFLLILLAVLDLFVKYYVFMVMNLPARGIVPFLPNLDLVFSQNYGVSFGLFPQGSEFGTFVLVGFNLLVAFCCAIWLISSRSIWLVLGTAFLAGGAIGNGLDRLWNGAVTDYLYFHVGSFDWYIFNLADAWIFIGAFFILIDNMLSSRRAKTGEDHG